MDSLILVHKEEDQKKARVASIIWMVLLLMVLIFPFMTIPNPPPEQQGVVVNLGFIDIGSGEESGPPQEASSSTEPQEAEPEKEETKPEKTKPKPKPEPKKEQPKKEPKKPKPTPVKDTKKVIEDNSAEIALKKAQEKAEKAQRDKERAEAQEQQEAADKEAAKIAEKAEAARRKQAEIDAQKALIAAQEAKQQAELDELRKSLSQDAKGTGNGNTTTPGTQGVEDGKKSDILEGISTGAGKVGGGISDRGGKGPEITDNSQETGIVVVKVCVDENGNVISAKSTQLGSTATSQKLKDKAVANAKSWNFKPGELDKSCGTITYDFKVK